MICCRTCADVDLRIRRATKVAPRYVGGEENGHVEWVPVCSKCFAYWYEDVPERDILPAFDLKGTLAHLHHPDHSLVTEEISRIS